MICGNDYINDNTNTQYIVYPWKVNGITTNNAGTQTIPMLIHK